jgi:uncharacterized membrane protein
MTNLVCASLFLPLSHFLIASTPLRAMLVRRLGERGYSLAYSALALAAFVWLVIAYRHAPIVPLWHAPRWLRLALLAVMLLSSILVVAGLTTRNPVIVRSGQLFGDPDIVRGILRVSRNPFFWGVGLFAVSHLIIIGDVAAVAAFGSVAVLGLAGAPILDAKKARSYPTHWQAFAAATSDIPFLAIMQGRQRLALGEIGWWRIALALALFALLVVFHRTLLGGDPLAVIMSDHAAWRPALAFAVTPI